MAVEVNNTATQANADKRTYSVQEIADILQISRSMAYVLCRKSLFKTVCVGKYVRISKPSFDIEPVKVPVLSFSGKVKQALFFISKLRKK